jgi:protein-tyrosine phosphatase
MIPGNVRRHRGIENGVAAMTRNATMSGDGTGERFRILVVCTGNICRSAAAEQALRAEFATRGDRAGAPRIDVSSAGTGAVVGHDVHPLTAAAMREHALAPAIHVARQLTAEQVEEADLVLAATRYHRQAVRDLVPETSSRVFTLREFARVADRGTTADDPWQTVERADVARRTAPAVSTRQDDVDDPITGGASDHGRAVGEIVVAARVCADVLRSNVGE